MLISSTCPDCLCSSKVKSICGISYPFSISDTACSNFYNSIQTINSWDMSAVPFGECLFVFFSDGSYTTTMPPAFLAANPALSSSNPSSLNMTMLQKMLGRNTASVTSTLTAPVGAAVYGFASSCLAFGLVRSQVSVGLTWHVNSFGPMYTILALPQFGVGQPHTGPDGGSPGAPFSLGAILVTNAGTGYSSATVNISPANGAIASAVVTTSGGVEQIIVKNPGNGFAVAPTITITGGSGNNATAKAFLSGTINQSTIYSPCSDSQSLVCCQYNCFIGPSGNISDPNLSILGGVLNIPVPCPAFTLPCLSVNSNKPISVGYIYSSP